MVTISYLWVSIDSLIKRARLLALIFTVSDPTFAFSQGVFVEKLRVQQESQLDWQYATEQVHLGVPTERMEKYKARKQLYDFFGPRFAPSRELPLILCISGDFHLRRKLGLATCTIRLQIGFDVGNLSVTKRRQLNAVYFDTKGGGR